MANASDGDRRPTPIASLAKLHRALEGQAMSLMKTPHDGEPLSDKEVATAIRRMFFATGILLVLAFAVICYAT